MLILLLPFKFLLVYGERPGENEMREEDVLNLVWCLILFFTFLHLRTCGLEFSASIKEKVSLVVMSLEYEMEK